MYRQNVKGLQIMKDIIYGKNAVTEALEAGTREINKIWIANNIHTDNKIAKIKELETQKHQQSTVSKNKSQNVQINKNKSNKNTPTEKLLMIKLKQKPTNCKKSFKL